MLRLPKFRRKSIGERADSLRRFAQGVGEMRQQHRLGSVQVIENKA